MSKWSKNNDFNGWKGISRRSNGRNAAIVNTREQGYTLIESLIVLSVFLVIASISAFLIKPQLLFLERQLFLNQLKADLFYAQQYAISHHHEVYVSIVPEQNMYYLRGRVSDGFLVKRAIPKEIKVVSGSQSLNFQFQPDGNINKFGSIYILVGKERYRMTFLIGRGRFYVEKE